MELYYQPELPESGQFTIDAEEAQHMLKTRRHRAGDAVQLTNGKGLLLTARLMQADTKHCTAQVVNSEKYALLQPAIHLAVSPLKQEARFEWVIEKAVEMGVHSIIPLLCERTEKVFLKQARLERLMVAALKQSLKFYLPRLYTPMKLSDWLLQAPGQRLFAHCHPGEKQIIGPQQAAAEMSLFIGPEGDFTEEEVLLAQNAGAIALSLGESRLRTETAALVAMSQAHHAYLLK
ncbi:MAG: RsmE family RNA methyltransferase [Bacteroidia bacterium]